MHNAETKDVLAAHSSAHHLPTTLSFSTTISPFYLARTHFCQTHFIDRDEILGDNPELVKEIEAEAERMRLENERLEQEIASMIDEHSSQEDGSGGSNGANHASSFSSEGEGTIVDIVDDESDEVIDLDRDAALSDSIEQGLPTNSNDGSDGMHSTEQPVPASAEDLPDLSFGAVTREVKAKILQDFHMLADLFVPKSARGPLKEALKPVVNVVRDTTKTIVDMVNRYTGQFFDKANSAEGAKQETAVAMK
jgi:hypothetical protein